MPCYTWAVRELDSVDFSDVARRYHLILILLFGSRVTGLTHARSDVDLAVLVEDEHQIDLVDLTCVFMSLLKTNDVDLVLLNTADYFLRYESAYFQDDWKVRPNLTLTYGLRYDYVNKATGRGLQSGPDMKTGEWLIALKEMPPVCSGGAPPCLPTELSKIPFNQFIKATGEICARTACGMRTLVCRRTSPPPRVHSCSFASRRSMCSTTWIWAIRQPGLIRRFQGESLPSPISRGSSNSV